IIFSSDNAAIASNKPSFSLIYFPGEKGSRGLSESMLDKMSQAIGNRLNINKDSVRETLKSASKRDKPVRIAENLSLKDMLLLSELEAVYPGLETVEEARRYYPFGAYLSHLIGYTGKMDARDWKEFSRDRNYSMDTLIGKNGLEKMYEKSLKGKDGGIFLEVDYRGRLIQRLESRKWIPGSDIYLTINSKAQAAAEAGLRKSISKKGAVVAIDPRDGSLLAFVSMPDYDPNQFAQPSLIKEKKLNLPEFNVALQGAYPPGSIFKIISSAAILESGKVKPEDSVNCPGYYDAGSRVFKCWKHTGHGKTDFKNGLAKSCDVYYYIMAQKCGALAIENFARAFRLGKPSGIDLPYERAGNVFGPGPRADKKSYWFIGDTLNLSIGQGETLMTPMQAVQMIAAIANGGTFYKPYYINRIVKPDGTENFHAKPQVLSRVEMKSETLRLIREALNAVVYEGTGYMSQIKGVKMFGKTGSAQNPHGEDHAWFVAYGTVGDEPARVAVSVLVEHGAHGSTEAAPIAKAVIEAVLADDIKRISEAESETKKTVKPAADSENDKKPAKSGGTAQNVSAGERRHE
ncbi:MAG: penicillin-binding protein 2, partial [Elusimicrobiales bacterium]|nr:penicillin-binding protein 2 [Elusimicrobiales bacterium]